MDNIYLICYDISDNRLRLKVANKLLFFGLERIQLSVFVGSMKKTLFAKAKQWLENHVKGNDKLLILPLPPQIIKNSLTYGEYVIDWPLLTNQQNTLYFE